MASFGILGNDDTDNKGRLERKDARDGIDGIKGRASLSRICCIEGNFGITRMPNPEANARKDFSEPREGSNDFRREGTVGNGGNDRSEGIPDTAGKRGNR